jgi:hypothetical protein
MIVVKLMGGLGNQMFQYAAARRLAFVNSAVLKLDLSWFRESGGSATPRHYELHALAIEENFATPEEVGRQVRYAHPVRRLLGKLAPSLVRSTCIHEKHFHFDPMILALSDDAYLEGYWQSEKYFMDIEGTIRREFSVKSEPGAWNGRMAESIRGTESVSLHVRRGDYVASKAASEYHGVCSLDYYRAAIEKIAAQVHEPHFYVFSDDPSWVQENLHFGYPATLVDHNDPDHGYEDLRLMSLCRHHIIANSSFSWWGAWLGSDPHKVVIAPRKWFRDESINTADLIPETWERM